VRALDLLVIKTGALGDVLRTTAILPGLARKHADLRVTWLTAHAARDMVRLHPLVARVVCVEPLDPVTIAAAGDELERSSFARVLSLDDEEPLCALASRLGGDGKAGVLTGAHLRDGRRTYTSDAAPWFDMGLLSRFGKAEADRLKLRNRESQPAIYARMLGIEPGEPELPLPEAALAFAQGFAERTALHAQGPVVGLNTGAGGRWVSKRLPVERVVRLVRELARRLDAPTFLLLGGPEEADRNAAIRDGVGRAARLVDAGLDNPLLDFAALVDRVDVLVTSDSLALHVAVARRRPVVAFFAPTSAAEIELYGRGEKVVSTAPDACTYRPDVDTSTLTVERLAQAVERTLGSRR